MSIIAKLQINDKTFNILKFNFSLNQKAGANGFPSSKPTGGIFNIVFETTKDALFFEWMISENTMKNLKIVLSPSTMNSKSRTIELLDAYCIKHQENFDGINNLPMMTYIQVSPAIMIQDGTKTFEWYWRVTDINTNVTPTTRENNEEETIDCYLTDIENNENPDLEKVNEVYLVIKTENMVGKTKDIDVSNFKLIFEYKDEILANNTLSNFNINSDLQKVKLKIVKSKSKKGQLAD